MIEKNKTFRVYQKPFTQGEYEGEARALRRALDRVESHGGHAFEWWMVSFHEYEEPVPRLISSRDKVNH